MQPKSEVSPRTSSESTPLPENHLKGFQTAALLENLTIFDRNLDPMQNRIKGY
ncbi:hypothetical protein ACKUB1_11705 [Methanospirillum stamsii]|uniref:hypothetical protein n=1 Tax=Methanospirillum stamsii TaxID=1277351 RepID=UPI0015E86A61|nr:hypothetical protein [Methanospirillum stamsii]